LLTNAELKVRVKKISRKQLVAAVAGTTALVGAAVWGGHWYLTGRFLEATDDAYVRADVVDVRSEVTGRIAAVPVRENQFVREGQALVEIEPADFRARADQATAEVAQADAALADANRQISLQEKNILEAEADIAAAAAELQRARLEVNRARELDRKGFASRQRLENTEADVAVAAARLKQAHAKHDAANALLTVIHARADKALADKHAGVAAAEYARLQLAKTTIVAPRDGVVGNLGARVGAMAQPPVILMHLVPVQNAYITANYKETQLSRMAIGQPATIEVDGLPGVVFTGAVESLAPGTGTEFSLLPQDNATGNFNKIVQRVPVRIRVTGPTRSLSRLRSGMSAVPEVDTRRFDESLASIDALRAQPERLTLQSTR
jgi:membrane fusion protein (multidrug efflux system)